jgi:hypothetical protein
MKAKRAGYSKQTRHPLRPTVDRRQRLVDPQLPQLLAQAGDFGVAAEAMADRIAVCVRGRPAPKLKLDAAADLDALGRRRCAFMIERTEPPMAASESGLRTE